MLTFWKVQGREARRHLSMPKVSWSSADLRSDSPIRSPGLAAELRSLHCRGNVTTYDDHLLIDLQNDLCLPFC